MRLQASFCLTSKAHMQFLLSGRVSARLGSKNTICQRMDMFNTYVGTHANTIAELRMYSFAGQRRLMRCVPQACSTLYWCGPGLLHCWGWCTSRRPSTLWCTAGS